MWAIRVLTGPQAGEFFNLRMGRNLLGRSPQCDIKINSGGVSKEHSEIMVYQDKIVITDLKSSNGTFLNGVRMQTGATRLGDKIGIHNILVDIVPSESGRRKSPNTGLAQRNLGASTNSNNAHYPGIPNSMSEPISVGPAPAYQSGGIKGLIEKISDYIDRVVLPGVYKLPTLIEFRLVLLGFIAAFIFVTTLLAMIPMVAISRSSVIGESKRRAGSLARTIAVLNQAAILQNSYSNLTTNQAESEDGVKQVLIVQQSDGMILAPATRAGTTPDLPFVHVARREMRPQSVEVDSSTIGASFPIGLFDANTGEQSVKAHAIVLYDVGSLAFDDGRTISLFLQALVFSSIVGLLIFYLMYKLIEYPISSLNSQLDIAMREKKDSTEVDFIFPPLQALIGNINSLLTRNAHGVNHEGGTPQYINKDAEAENLVQMIGYPSVAIAKDGKIIACNATFAQFVRIDILALQGHMYTVIPDNALQQNLENLVSKSKENFQILNSDQLEFSGHMCLLTCQAMCTSASEVEYYLITVSPMEAGNS